MILEGRIGGSEAGGFPVPQVGVGGGSGRPLHSPPKMKVGSKMKVAMSAGGGETTHPTKNTSK